MMRDQVRRFVICAPLFALSVGVSMYAVFQIADGSVWSAFWFLVAMAAPFAYHYARIRLGFV